MLFYLLLLNNYNASQIQIKLNTLLVWKNAFELTDVFNANLSTVNVCLAVGRGAGRFLVMSSQFNIAEVGHGF